VSTSPLLYSPAPLSCRSGFLVMALNRTGGVDSKVLIFFPLWFCRGCRAYRSRCEHFACPGPLLPLFFFPFAPEIRGKSFRVAGRPCLRVFLKRGLRLLRRWSDRLEPKDPLPPGLAFGLFFLPQWLIAGVTDVSYRQVFFTTYPAGPSLHFRLNHATEHTTSLPSVHGSIRGLHDLSFPPSRYRSQRPRSRTVGRPLPS